MNQREWIESLFRDHAKDLMRYLMSFRLPADETYDIVQTVFMKLMEVKPKQIKYPKAWLYKVGRNLAITSYNRNKNRAGSADPDDTVSERPGVLTRMLEEEENDLLWQAFAQLKPDEQELYRLILDHELSAKQVAEVVGKSYGSIKVAMHRIRQKLKDIIEHQNQVHTAPAGAL